LKSARRRVFERPRLVITVVTRETRFVTLRPQCRGHDAGEARHDLYFKAARRDDCIENVFLKCLLFARFAKDASRNNHNYERLLVSS